MTFPVLVCEKKRRRGCPPTTTTLSWPVAQFSQIITQLKFLLSSHPCSLSLSLSGAKKRNTFERHHSKRDQIQLESIIVVHCCGKQPESTHHHERQRTRTRSNNEQQKRRLWHFRFLVTKGHTPIKIASCNK